jgi:IS5 family transposase
MKDLNKNVETEKPIEVQNELKKETADNATKAPVKRIRVRAKAKPTPSVLIKNASVPVAAVEVSTPDVNPPKAAKSASAKVKKTEATIVVEKSPKKEKAEITPMVKKEILVDSKEEKQKPDSIKVIKKKAKKAEAKVDKLKKKVKKAKKKDVKKSKLKGLKEKLGKALKKFNESVEKLKEGNK